MTYAVVTRESITDSWRVAKVGSTRVNAERQYGSFAANLCAAMDGKNPPVAALAVLHTTRYIGNIVDVNEMTIVKSICR